MRPPPSTSTAYSNVFATVATERTVSVRPVSERSQRTLRELSETSRRCLRHVSDTGALGGGSGLSEAPGASAGEVARSLRSRDGSYLTAPLRVRRPGATGPSGPGPRVPTHEAQTALRG